jgi:hypothetical protein
MYANGHNIESNGLEFWNLNPLAAIEFVKEIESGRPLVNFCFDSLRFSYYFLRCIFILETQYMTNQFLLKNESK